MYGVKLGDYHSYNDLGLILSKKVISPPSPQISTVTVPMRDGSIDLTESLTDDIKYNDRKITLTFSLIGSKATWDSKFSDIANLIHGQKMKIIFDEDPAFYWYGRASINNWTTDKRLGTMVVEATVEPFKYDVVSSAVDWEWDIFDFENSIINETGELIVNGETTISLICRKKRMFPIFTASAAMTVTYDGETFNLSKGSQKMYGIFLTEGSNELTFKGNGTITIDYIGGSL